MATEVYTLNVNLIRNSLSIPKRPPAPITGLSLLK
jgi:hypothetical protein